MSSENIDAKDILKVYYTRQSIEQIFDTQKNNVDLLPLRAHSEITFRGHLMLTFLMLNF
ncbi:MAG: transposase [Holosporales bacterium]|nr:transposase [Holosporales bacterium]